MKQLQKSVLALVVLAFCAAPLWAQGRGPTTTQTPSRVSPHETISNRIGAGRGGVLVTITYGRPYSRDNRSGAIRVLTRTLKIDEPIAAKVYDSSRPTMTADGALSEDGQKKMAAFVAKSGGVKDIAPAEKLFDFSFVRKAQAALQAKGWQPGS